MSASMTAMNSLVTRLPEIVSQLLAFALALSIHESAHGWMAERLGDPTARWLGRITLNPLKHVDPIGTVVFPLFLAFINAPVIGWAKPVPFVSRNLKNQKWGPGLVALAGPVSNVALGAAVTIVLLVMKATMPMFKPLLFAVLSQGALGARGIAAPIIYFLYFLAAINIMLAVFNLIPIPPLDGSHLLQWVLPARFHYHYAQLGRFGMLILFGLLWIGALGVILRPFFNLLVWLLLG